MGLLLDSQDATQEQAVGADEQQALQEIREALELSGECSGRRFYPAVELMTLPEGRTLWACAVGLRVVDLHVVGLRAVGCMVGRTPR